MNQSVAKSVLINRVTDKLFELCAVVEREYRTVVVPPAVSFHIRGSSAGYADYRTRSIDFNMILLRDNAVPFIANTVPHEFAHIAVQDVHGPVGFQHGGEWQDMMEVLGAKAEITHKYDLSKTVRTYQWECGCMTHQLSQYVHRRLLKGTAYQCHRCGQDITKGR